MPPIRRRGGGPKNRQARLSGGDTVPPAPTATVDAPGGAVRRLVYCRHALAFVETDHGHNALRRVPFGDELHEAPVDLVLSLYSSLQHEAHGVTDVHAQPVGECGHVRRDDGGHAQ